MRGKIQVGNFLFDFEIERTIRILNNKIRKHKQLDKEMQQLEESSTSISDQQDQITK